MKKTGIKTRFANQDVCRECSKAQAEEKSGRKLFFEFFKRKIPKNKRILKIQTFKLRMTVTLRHTAQMK